MKIVSADNRCWIAVHATSDGGGYSVFDVTCQVDLGHGEFAARNRNMHFLNLDEFVSEFDRFIIDRTLAPRLNGTYDSYIEFSAVGIGVICEYRIGDAFAGRKTVRFVHAGAFEIEQEKLLEFFHGFRALLPA